MSLESDLRTFVLADAGVAALIGTRMYPQRLPDNPTLPAVAYQRVSTLYEQASGHVALVRARIQLAAWDDNAVTASDVAAAIHTRLDFSAPTGLHAAFPEDEDSSYDPEAQLYRTRLDFFCWKVT